MINYVKSENYRILRKKSLYITTAICFLLMTVAAIVLYLMPKADPNFPYSTSLFLYSNVISGGLLILIVSFLFNGTLTGRDSSVIKQSISFGISRGSIYWSKLLLTVSYFLAVCCLGLVLIIGLGEGLLKSEEQT